MRESAESAAGADEHPATRILHAAYPAGHERDRAIRWLAWLAWQMRASRNLAWWDIPAWIGEPGLRFARALTGAVLLGLAFGLGFGGYAGSRGLAAGPLAAIAAVYISTKLRPGKLRRARSLRAMIPRLPRSGREAAILALAVLTGLFLRRTLISLWACPVTDSPSASPDGSYRACRRSTAIDGTACLLTGLPGCVAALALGQLELVPVAAALAGFAVLTALADGTVPALKQAELTLLFRRRRRVSFHRLLEGALDRQLLVPAGAYYQFRDRSVQEYLLGIQQAALDERTRRTAERKRRAAARARRIADAAAGKRGARAWLLGLLSAGTSVRIAVDLGCGAALAAIGRLLPERGAGWHSVPAAALGSLGVIVTSLVLGLSAFVFAFLLLDRLAWSLRWSLWLTGRMPPSVRVAVAAVAVAAAGMLTWLAGPAAVRHGIAVTAVAIMPAATVATVGGWACALVHRRCRTARRRLLRYTADALLAAVAAVALLLLLDRNLLAAQAAAGLLFPVAVWLSVIGWRAMNGSDHFAVRAAADIVISLMLGSTLVLLLVWLANLLHMPTAEVRVLRGALGRAGAATDLPWWWTSLYLLLAAASLAFAVWPGRLSRVTGWFARLRVVPSVTVTSRVSSGVHIGLLVVVLIGLAAPAAMEPALRARLADRYTETLTDNLRARGELAAYKEITDEFSLGDLPILVPLADLILAIDRTGKPPDGRHGATSVELDLARRLGELQAVTLAPRPPDVTQAEAAAARQAGFDAPAAGPGEENQRLAGLDSAEKKDDDAERLADQAAELAASALAKALQLPGLGNTEVVQVIREYLSGLIENSPVKDVFAAWAGRIAGRSAPRPTAEIVVPDPGRLKDAAAAAATSELARTPVTDPAAVGRFLGETAVVAAVDLANQVRYLQEGGGPCEGCARPEPPGDRPGQGPEDHPFEPHFVP